VADGSTIEWTEATWSPTTGCDMISPGCDNCYALTLAKRLKAMGSAKYQTDGDPRTSGPGFGLAVHEGALTVPLRWRKPRRIFVNSMSDLFHDKVSDEFIARVFAVMAATPHHTYQLLTKRHGRMRSLVGGTDGSGYRLLEATTDEQTAQTLYDAPWPLPNVWLGVSIEDQQWAGIRIPALLDTPAAVRWLSCEPLLGPVSLVRWLNGGFGNVAPADLDWIVVGGESGPGARPLELAWVRHLVEECQAAGVAPFVKQLGSRWGRHHHDIEVFPPDLQVREYPQEATQ
jgi:protein gp37